MNLKRLAVGVPLVLAMGCQSPLEPTRSATEAVGSTQSAVPESELAEKERKPKTSGGGHLLVSGLIDATFSFSAVQHAPDLFTGKLHYALTLDGLPVEFHGRVTCIAVDSVTHRAWIGGVVTRNNSEHPSYTTARTQVGRDIWFRVVDNGQGEGGPPDRSTFVGFEGDRGILTSAEYCAARLWVDGDVGTHPVTTGSIHVKP